MIYGRNHLALTGRDAQNPKMAFSTSDFRLSVVVLLADLF
jgi:hypothetical protein